MITTVQSIVKNHRNFLRNTTFLITYAMCITAVFTSIMAMAINLMIAFMISLLVKPTPLYTSYLYSIPANGHTVDIDYPQGLCLTAFAVDEFFKIIFLSIYSFN